MCKGDEEPGEGEEGNIYVFAFERMGGGEKGVSVRGKGDGWEK